MQWKGEQIIICTGITATVDNALVSILVDGAKAGGYPPVHSHTHTLHCHQQWTPTCPLIHPHTTLPSTTDTLLSTHTSTHYTTINNGYPPVHSYTHTLHYHQQWTPSRPLTHPHTTLPSTTDTLLSTHTPTHYTIINNGHPPVHSHTHTLHAINNGHPPVHSHTHTLHYHQQWTPTCPLTRTHTTLPLTMGCNHMQETKCQQTQAITIAPHWLHRVDYHDNLRQTRNQSPDSHYKRSLLLFFR